MAIEASSAELAEFGLEELGEPVAYSGSTVYALLDFDISVYPGGFQSQRPVSANMAVFNRADIDSEPVGDTFTYGVDTYTILQVVPEESDTNLIAVLFE